MKKFDTYREAEDYILSIPKFTKKNKFEVTKRFYQFLGKPGNKAKILHVAGTNGKGSVCAYMNSVLNKEGIPTGMFTSPHLLTMRERMQFQNEMIREEEFLRVFHACMERVEEFQKEEKEYHPTFFEILFFMSMLWFEEKNPEVLILETGLGGLLDTTNVTEDAKVCIITTIGYDHMEYLGTTLEEIAEQKAGIIKPKNKVVYSRNRQETDRIIEQKAAKMGAFCKPVSKPEDILLSFADKMIDFSFTSRYYGYIPIRINTAALYQAENAHLALTALEEAELRISRKSMVSGVSECFWPARMEEILPRVYLDGAHNEEGISAFLSTVSKDGCGTRRWLLFSAVADKEYLKMKEKVSASGLFDQIYTAPLKNTRGLKKEELEGIFLEEKVTISDTVKDGLLEILSLKGKEDFVYVAGSLYLAGEIKEVMINFEEELKKFHPSLEIEDAEDALYRKNLTDIADLVVELVKEAKEDEEK